MNDPPPIDIEEAQVEQRIQKAEQGTLGAAEQKRLVPLLGTLTPLTCNNQPPKFCSAVTALRSSSDD